MTLLIVVLATVAGAQNDFDFGDAPDSGVDPMWSYPTLLADDGARHLIPASPTYFLDGGPTPFIERVSVDSSGAQGNSVSFDPSISADGRCVAFSSYSANLVPADTNENEDVFVHDRDSGTTTRVSVDSSGAQGDSSSRDPSISADGRWVAFESYSANLVPDDTNDTPDVFVHDRDSGTTTRVSVDSSGAQGDSISRDPSISADGRHVAFMSLADNLVPDDTNHTPDVFVHDRDTGTTKRVSVSSTGGQGNEGSFDPSISADGRCVAFSSYSANLVPADTNESEDVFVHDRDSGTTTRVSVDSIGGQANCHSIGPSISADGRWVAFESYSTNLVPDDTNHTFDVFVHGESDPLDAEPDGAPTLLAIGDDHVGHNDEGGVRFPCYMEPGGTATVQIDASAAGFVNAWIDFDFDGDWGDSGEQILTDHPVAAGWNEISFAVPAAGEIPLTYARVRFTSYDTAGSLGVTGQADDGEVEDYWVVSSMIFLDRFESGDTSRWSETAP